ncbi:GntR family transcriptional regulator, partial [Novosphingobium sp. B-7]
MQQRIRSDQATPLYMQLAHALIHEIERGRLQPGSALPSSRELAAELGFNRKTVVTAYEELMAQGWLEAAGRKGTAVAKRLPRSRPEAIEASPPIGRRPIYRFVSPP